MSSYTPSSWKARRVGPVMVMPAPMAFQSGSMSIRSTSIPFRLMAMAADMPPTPPPTIRTLYLFSVLMADSFLVVCSGFVGQIAAEEIPGQGAKGLGMFDLGPVPALAEDVQLAIFDPLKQGLGRGKGDDLVIPAMYHQGLVLDTSHLVFLVGHFIDP